MTAFLQCFLLGARSEIHQALAGLLEILGEMFRAPQREASRRAPRFRADFVCHMCVASHVATASWQKRKWIFLTPPRKSPLIQPLVVVRQVQEVPYHQHGRSSTNVVSPLAHIINTPSKPQPTTTGWREVGGEKRVVTSGRGPKQTLPPLPRKARPSSESTPVFRWLRHPCSVWRQGTPTFNSKMRSSLEFLKSPGFLTRCCSGCCRVRGIYRGRVLLHGLGMSWSHVVIFCAELFNVRLQSPLGCGFSLTRLCADTEC